MQLETRKRYTGNLAVPLSQANYSLGSPQWFLSSCLAPTIERLVENRPALVALVAVLVAAGVAACDPYACGTEARSATYAGLLGQAVPPTSPPAERPWTDFS